jgi:tRNA threonylcarbamoyladenosine biosynthesis protein TsaB
MHGFSIAAAGTDDAAGMILALDTTAGACSAALVGAGRCEQRIEPSGPTHSRRVLGMVEALLAQSGIDGARLDAIAFGAGPGSFTGLRVACGVAQGLAFGWRLPVVPVGSMPTLALQAAEAGGASLLLVAIDARMGEVYRSAWLRAGDRVEPLLAAAAVTPEAAREEFASLVAARGPAIAAGDAFAGMLGEWCEAAGVDVSAPETARQPQAAVVARLSRQALIDGRAVDAADAAPVYVRDKVALDVDEQAALRARRALRVAPGA